MTKTKIIRIAAISLAVILISSIGWMLNSLWSSGTTRSVTDTSETIYKAIEAGDYLEAYQFAESEFKSAIDEKEFETAMSTLEKEKLKVGEVNEVYKGTYDYMLQYDVVNENNESKGTFTIFVYQADGKWQFKDAFFNVG